MQNVPVIDADGHVLETDAELEQYFDGPYKGPPALRCLFHLPFSRRLAPWLCARFGQGQPRHGRGLD